MSPDLLLAEMTMGEDFPLDTDDEVGPTNFLCVVVGARSPEPGILGHTECIMRRERERELFSLSLGVVFHLCTAR